MTSVGFKVVYGPKKVTKRTAFRPATSSALQRIRYRMLDWTIQNDEEYGPFALFTSLKDAREFASKAWCGSRGCILICEYEPSLDGYLWKKNPPVFTKSRSRFRSECRYYAQSAGTTKRSWEDCPAGTVLASRVRPIAVVNDNDPDSLEWRDPDTIGPLTSNEKVVFDQEGGFHHEKA